VKNQTKNKFTVKSTRMFTNRLLSSNEHITWLQSSSWSDIILMKWSVFCCWWVPAWDELIG